MKTLPPQKKKTEKLLVLVESSPPPHNSFLVYLAGRLSLRTLVASEHFGACFPTICISTGGFGRGIQDVTVLFVQHARVCATRCRLALDALQAPLDGDRRTATLASFGPALPDQTLLSPLSP